MHDGAERSAMGFDSTTFHMETLSQSKSVSPLRSVALTKFTFRGARRKSQRIHEKAKTQVHKLAQAKNARVHTASAKVTANGSSSSNRLLLRFKVRHWSSLPNFSDSARLLSVSSFLTRVNWRGRARVVRFGDCILASGIRTRPEEKQVQPSL